MSEKTVAMTVMRLPAMDETTARAAVAPPEKTIGSAVRLVIVSWSRYWVRKNRGTAPAVIKAGKNQKLAFNLPHKESSFPTDPPSMLPLCKMVTVEYTSWWIRYRRARIPDSPCAFP